MTVHGVLEIDAGAPGFTGAVAHVAIEDARRAGAPAEQLASLALRHLSHRPGVAERVPFTMSCPDPAAGVRLSIRAWVDITGLGSATGGDLFSTDRVTIDGRAAPVLVRVAPSGGSAGR